MDFWLTAHSNSGSREEILPGFPFTFHSRSGLHPAETAVLRGLAALRDPGETLLGGGRTGASAMLAAELSGRPSFCHVLDAYHEAQVRRSLIENRFEEKVRLACSPFPPEQLFDTVVYIAADGDVSGELCVEQIDSFAKRLKPGGVFLLGTDCQVGPLAKQLKQTVGNAAVEKGLLRAVKTVAETKSRSFAAEFDASLPGQDPVKLMTLPGVFCHRRPDMGGLALAETAVRFLKPGQRVLDFGCGCGMVGILLAKAVPGTRCVFVDSHARAVECTRRNLDALGMPDHRVELSAAGWRDGVVDCFVGNPPYYGDYSIAELFLDNAQQTVGKGGLVFFVAKNPRKLHELMSIRFGDIEEIPRRGYTVLKATV